MGKQDQDFTEQVWTYYRRYGRHNLPWRKQIRPYQILVSELMLQQTQVDRVLPKYQLFLRQFPSCKQLADASLTDVLRAWQGLGYNRRAKFLHETARLVAREHSGRFPASAEQLLALPGIGPYTAGAIMVFAYNKPSVLIETNVRQVFLHHYFSDYEDVSDTEIRTLVARTLPEDCPREWYWALMDYGSYLKRTHGNATVRSRHYTKQSKFTGSDREIRGAIVRTLAELSGTITEEKLQRKLPQFASERISSQLARLVAEGMVVCCKQRYGLG